MSAPSQPSDSRMNTNSTSSSSPGNILNADIPATKNKVFDEHGVVGKQFTENGALGGTAQAVGGPLDKNGVIGKQFTTEGIIGGTV
ncbi:hypothetical protein OQA88_11200 [Cercophora sp. LCS_1]